MERSDQSQHQNLDHCPDGPRYLVRGSTLPLLSFLPKLIFDSYSASLSACIRLKYTVALTNQEDYLYGVADVVIWGFAENSLGMIVGNVATLRPLFRILRDGKSSDYKTYHQSPGINSSHRTGGGMRSRNYELSENMKGPNHTTTTSAIDHNPRGSLSDGESQKNILDNGQQPGEADIVVSRQIVVAYD